MDNTRKWYIALSIFLTTVFVVLGATIFQRSFVRFWETLGELLSSCKFYFCEIFEIEHKTSVGVIDKSEVLEWNYILPETSEGFGKRAGLFFRLWVNGGNLTGFTKLLGEKAEIVSRVLVLVLPLLLLL